MVHYVFKDQYSRWFVDCKHLYPTTKWLLSWENTNAHTLSRLLATSLIGPTNVDSLVCLVIHEERVPSSLALSPNWDTRLCNVLLSSSNLAAWLLSNLSSLAAKSSIPRSEDFPASSASGFTASEYGFEQRAFRIEDALCLSNCHSPSAPNVTAPLHTLEKNYNEMEHWSSLTYSHVWNPQPGTTIQSWDLRQVHTRPSVSSPRVALCSSVWNRTQTKGYLWTLIDEDRVPCDEFDVELLSLYGPFPTSNTRQLQDEGDYTLPYLRYEFKYSHPCNTAKCHGYEIVESTKNVERKGIHL